MQAWQNAFRLISSNFHSRSACNLCYRILLANKLPYSAVSESVGAMIESAPTNGPATVSEASLAFWQTIQGLISEQGSNRTLSRCNDQLDAWIRAKWRPSETTLLFIFFATSL